MLATSGVRGPTRGNEQDVMNTSIRQELWYLNEVASPRPLGSLSREFFSFFVEDVSNEENQV
jgi:hypothetical protein